MRAVGKWDPFVKLQTVMMSVRVLIPLSHITVLLLQNVLNVRRQVIVQAKQPPHTVLQVSENVDVQQMLNVVLKAQQLPIVIQKEILTLIVKNQALAQSVITSTMPNHTMSVAKAVLNVHPQVIIVLGQRQFV